MSDIGDRPGRTAARAAGIRRQRQLPMHQAVRFAWRSIRARLGRSLLVLGAIVLALSFLTYITCSDAIARSLARQAGEELLEQLQRQGRLSGLGDADARVQTWWMAGLALVVSFVGVVNAMLLSVAERFGEIGTMKCLGALDSLIVKLFMLESAFQGLLGSAAGALLGCAVAVAEAFLACGRQAAGLLPYADLAGLVGLSFGAGVTLTIAAGLYPAWRAARMRPVEAMRVEV